MYGFGSRRVLRWELVYDSGVGMQGLEFQILRLPWGCTSVLNHGRLILTHLYIVGN